MDLMEGGAPVEVKYRGAVTDRDLVQLALYALMLERVGARTWAPATWASSVAASWQLSAGSSSSESRGH